MPIVTVTAPGQGDESVPAPGTAQPATDLRYKFSGMLTYKIFYFIA